MAIFIGYPKFDAGTSNAGAKLFTYEAGTSTKQATYTTPDESSANTNPVVLDSLGQANVLPGTGKSYKYVLAPSTDTDPPVSPIWTVDNISTSSSAGGAPSVVNTLAELKALPSGAFTVVTMLGSSSAGDGAGATYYWNATSTTANDDLYVVQPSSSPATGRWLMLADDLYIRSATPKLRLADTDGSGYHDIAVATDTLTMGTGSGAYLTATNSGITTNDDFLIGNASGWSSDSEADLGNGVVDGATAHAARDDVSGKSVIILSPTTTSTDYYGFEGLVSRRQYLLINNGCNDAYVIYPGSASTQFTISVNTAVVMTYYGTNQYTYTV